MILSSKLLSENILTIKGYFNFTLDKAAEEGLGHELHGPSIIVL